MSLGPGEGVYTDSPCVLHDFVPLWGRSPKRKKKRKKERKNERKKERKKGRKDERKKEKKGRESEKEKVNNDWLMHGTLVCQYAF